MALYGSQAESQVQLSSHLTALSVQIKFRAMPPPADTVSKMAYLHAPSYRGPLQIALAIAPLPISIRKGQGGLQITGGL